MVHCRGPGLVSVPTAGDFAFTTLGPSAGGAVVPLQDDRNSENESNNKGVELSFFMLIAVFGSFQAPA